MAGVTALDLFKGRHFDQDVIVLCVRWYLSFKLSSRDLVQMMSERGIVLAHTTILRRGPKLRAGFLRSAGASTPDRSTMIPGVATRPIKVKGRWTYLYRAVDKQGRTVDSY